MTQRPGTASVRSFQRRRFYHINETSSRRDTSTSLAPLSLSYFIRQLASPSAAGTSAFLLCSAAAATALLTSAIRLLCATTSTGALLPELLAVVPRDDHVPRALQVQRDVLHLQGVGFSVRGELAREAHRRIHEIVRHLHQESLHERVDDLAGRAPLQELREAPLRKHAHAAAAGGGGSGVGVALGRGVRVLALRSEE